MPSALNIEWINGWSQEAFFSIQAPLILPRPRRSQGPETIVDRIDWLLAGRMRRLLEQSGETTSSDWTMNALFLGERPLAILWYDGSQDLMSSIAKACEIITSSGRKSMCFVTDSPMSHLRAQTANLTDLAANAGMESLNIWAS